MVLVYFQFTNTYTQYTEIQIHSYTEIQIHSYCVIEAIEQQTFAQSPRFICSSFKNPICSKAFHNYLIFSMLFFSSIHLFSVKNQIFDWCEFFGCLWGYN